MISDRFRNRHLYAPLGAIGRPRQHNALLTAWLVRGFLPLPRTAGVKTNLPMCLKPRERLSLGRFAEQVRSWLHFAAAAVPCKRPLLLPFPAERKRKGPRGLSADFFRRNVYSVTVWGSVCILFSVKMDLPSVEGDCVSWMLSDSEACSFCSVSMVIF